MFFDLDGAYVGGVERRGVRLQCDQGRIVAVEEIPVPGNGRFALPGFVNAHCHLDLTSIRGEELPRADFARWVEAMVDRRRKLGPDQLCAAVKSGMRELLESGTVAVGDIDSTGASAAVLRQGPLQGVVFHEIIGALSEEGWGALHEQLLAQANDRAGVRPGLSPHAPFSTPEGSFRRCLRLASELDLPVATHLAETREEIEFLQEGRGPYAELFHRWGIDRPRWESPRSGAIHRVVSLLADDRPAAFLGVHANYPDSEEFDCLGQQGVTVVYCPRSHRYFGHARHPLDRYLQRGIQVALGTDSMASNFSLDLWQEIRVLRDEFPSLPASSVFALATSAGRKALDLEPARLRPGDPATFQIVGTRGDRSVESEGLLQLAVCAGLRTVATWIEGKCAAEVEG